MNWEALTALVVFCAFSFWIGYHFARLTTGKRDYQMGYSAGKRDAYNEIYEVYDDE